MSAQKTQRLLRLSIAVYGKEGVSREEAHDFVVNNHVVKATKIHAKHGIQAYQQVFSPPAFREIITQMNERNNRGWDIDDHDVTVEFYFHSMADLAKLSADPEWLAIQQEEEPYINRVHNRASLGWVEKYIENGQVVNVHEGKSTLGGWKDLSDTSTLFPSSKPSQ